MNCYRISLILVGVVNSILKGLNNVCVLNYLHHSDLASSPGHHSANPLPKNIMQEDRARVLEHPKHPSGYATACSGSAWPSSPQDYSQASTLQCALYRSMIHADKAFSELAESAS